MTVPRQLASRPDRGSTSAGVVALFIPNLDVGGAERTTIILAHGLRARGFAVDLVAGDTSGALRAEVPEGVRIVDLGAPRIRGALPGLVRYLRRRRPAWLAPTIEDANVLAIIAARIAGGDTRVVARIANNLSAMESRSRDLPSRVTFFGVRRLYPRAAALVACSQGVADDLRTYLQAPRTPMTMIHQSAVDPNLSALAAEPVDHPFFAQGAPPVVTAVGRLAEQKNFPLLLDAFALLRREAQARLLILGDGHLRARLEAQVRALGLESDIDLPGWDVNPYRYLARSQVFALSSDFEGLPGVLIEALGCGVPAVATDCPSGPREILADGRYGVLVPMNDPKALARGLQRQLTDPIPVPREAWEPYTAERVAEQYERLFERLT